jgi:hypothetical protein
MFFALAIGVHAQDGAGAKKIQFGITGGLSLGNFNGSDAAAGTGETKKMRMGFAGGLFADFDVSPSFAIRPQVLYVQKGAKYEEAGFSTKYKVDYIEVPVLLKWVPKMEGKMQPTIFAGPFLGLLMTAKADSFDFKDSSKTTEFGVTFGAGFGTKMTSGELFFDVRLDLGLSKIDDSAEKLNIKNTAFMALIGYKFGN